MCLPSGRTDGRMDAWMVSWTERQMDRWMDRQTDRQMDGWMVGRIERWADEGMDGKMETRKCGQTNKEPGMLGDREL